jgi:hypothetical protein
MSADAGLAMSFGVPTNSSSEKAGRSIDSTGVILWSSTRPEIFFARREIKQLVLLSLAFAFVFLYPILCDSSLSGPGIGAWLIRPQLEHFTAIPSDGADRDLFVQLRWVPYYTLTHFHQLPFWNPYKCGGMPMLGNPESAIVTPFLLLYLIFGLIPGMLLEIYLHVAIMFAGGYVLGRELGLVPLAALVLAAMFPSSSWLSLHIALGHLNFLSAAYIPWILALLLASCRLRRWHLAMLGGLLCALTLTEGNYGFVFAAMLVAIVAVWYATTQLSVRPLLAASLIGIFAIAFSMPRLIPTAELLTIHPREIQLSYLSWHGALVSLFSRDQDLCAPMVASFLFSEYAGYIGAPFALLALIGAIGNVRKSFPWVLGAIFFFTLFRGDTSPNAPTMWLRLLPLAGNIGLCGRWVVPLVFCVGVLAALGAQSLCERPQQWGRRLAGILITVGVADAWLVCAPNYRYLFQPAARAPAPSQTFRQYYTEWAPPFTSIAMAGMGSLSCGDRGYHVDPPKGTVLGYNQTGYRGEYYLLGAGKVTETLWSPNLLRYEVDVPQTTSLVVNQIMYPGWRLTHGNGFAYAENGLIAVRVPSGRQEIELVYTPRHIVAACAIALFALATLIVVWRIESQSVSRRRSNPC